MDVTNDPNPGVNDPPVAVNNAYSTNLNTTLNVPAPGVLGNDTDPENNALTAILVSGPSNASSFILNADGSFSYTPNGGFTGQDQFRYKAKDPSNAESNEATVTITVQNVPTTAPSAPTPLSAVKTNSTTAHLSWPDVAGETRYELQRCRTSFCFYSTVNSNISANTISYDNTGLGAGTYRWRIRACNGLGCSPYTLSNNVTLP